MTAGQQTGQAAIRCKQTAILEGVSSTELREIF